jgi:transposase-like protein
MPNILSQYQDENTCRKMLEVSRWKDGTPHCPYCGWDKYYVIEGGKRYKCANNTCHKKYSATVGTVFENSNIKLPVWFTAMHIITAHKKGISSCQLARDLDVTQKTAWFMLHRIREALKDKNSPILSGTVQSDETYMARKYRSDYKGLPPEQVEYKMTRGTNMGAVLGLYENNTGKIVVRKFDSREAPAIRTTIKEIVKAGSTLHTDEANLYRRGLDEYKHYATFHSKRRWKTDGAHTNNVENFWSGMKRGVYGIYHQISFKHLQSYCDEFSYRYNSRKLTDKERFIITLEKLEGRLSYKRLINKQ